MATLHLVCLAFGTERSNPTLHLERELRAVRLAAHEWCCRLGDPAPTPERIARLESIQWEIAERALLCGGDVLLETSLKTHTEREPYRLRATALGAETRVYIPRSSQDYLTEAEGIREGPRMDEGW